MSSCSLETARSLRGAVILPGDKSIAHRALMIGAIARGITRIDNFPLHNDSAATVNALRALGIRIVSLSPTNKRSIKVYGRFLRGFCVPRKPVHTGESGTTLRLLLGILAGQSFTTRVTAAPSLSSRPMRRITEPLRRMGARIEARKKAGALEEYPPLTIRGGELQPITWSMVVASAQVKSAILLAGLYARGKTTIREPVKTRDHTERMLKAFQARIKTFENAIVIQGGRELRSPGRIYVPGDISSASFFLVAACLVPDSRLVLKQVGLNPSRSGILKVLKRMKADISIARVNDVNSRKKRSFEPSGTLVARSSQLRGTTVLRKEIPSLIDELPILMVAASLAQGRTVFRGVEELRVKETDRIRSMTGNLRAMGADISVIRQGGRESIVIKGPRLLRGCRVSSFGDHRTAMSLIVAGLCARGRTTVTGTECIAKSFPGFLETLTPLIKS
ncbi:MAG TPA: 3-phosphoshikimate 1-carboxyvinyltransferase [Candidatus Omnitrophota bacterium]|nr:3-phosphoshikimate 1-carboxyvinyltransferase [Candidatus Omnitrophota bacterium]HRZ15266.1 3-phosphoshikimate 1-carboxyvinyltransferase [Candidatus Omnitrophota bacterium]